MAFTLTFYSLEEKFPAHEQEIAYFDGNMSLDYGVVFYTLSDGDGTEWVYDGTESNGEFTLLFNVENEDTGAFTYGSVSKIKKQLAKCFYWTDFNNMSQLMGCESTKITINSNV